MTDGTPSATDILTQAAAELADRARTYDAPEGERSMGKTVAAFNAITGHDLTEQQGWQFMELLKIVRSNQGAFRADSFTDAAAYAALAGEAASRADRDGKSGIIGDGFTPPKDVKVVDHIKALSELSHGPLHSDYFGENLRNVADDLVKDGMVIWKPGNMMAITPHGRATLHGIPSRE